MHTASRRTILRSIAALLAADFARGDTKHSRRFPFVQWDVFSKVRLAGNPLVVFPDARGLSDEEMQAITREIHQQETTFVIPREPRVEDKEGIDRNSTRLNSSHLGISYAVFCLKKKKKVKPSTNALMSSWSLSAALPSSLRS